MRVQHLMHDGKLRPHIPTAGARIMETGKLRYDALFEVEDPVHLRTSPNSAKSALSLRSAKCSSCVDIKPVARCGGQSRLTQRTLARALSVNAQLSNVARKY